LSGGSSRSHIAPARARPARAYRPRSSSATARRRARLPPPVSSSPRSAIYAKRKGGCWRRLTARETRGSSRSDGAVTGETHSWHWPKRIVELLRALSYLNGRRVGSAPRRRLHITARFKDLNDSSPLPRGCRLRGCRRTGPHPARLLRRRFADGGAAIRDRRHRVLRRALIGPGGAYELATDDPEEAQVLHQALYGATRRRHPLAVQLGPDLSAP
jgi:hypothetical protein